MALHAVPQQGFDEQAIEDKELEAALEQRESLKAIASGATATYREADEAAKGLVARLELPDGGAARVGRFRITRRVIKGGVRSFETKTRSQLVIGLADE